MKKVRIRERGGIIIKPPHRVSLSAALIYPNLYRIGMSGYTLRFLYNLFNSYPEVRCERFFMPDKIIYPYTKAVMTDKNALSALYSVDSGDRLDGFDVAAFTFQFEPDFFNILWFLDALGIKLRNTRRLGPEAGDKPLVIIGGPVLRANPLPALSIADIVFVGDFEPVADDFIRTLIEYNDLLRDFNLLYTELTSASEKREITDNDAASGFSEFLQKIGKIPGVLIARDVMTYLETGRAFFGYPRSIPVLENLDASPHPVFQIRADIDELSERDSIFLDTYLIELGRGCPYRCRFCLTGNLLRPFRNRSVSDISRIITEGNLNDFDRIGLIGSALADYPDMDELLDILENPNKKLILPSVRIDRLEDELSRFLRKHGTTSLTIAPETGSDDLRFIVNKRITNRQIISSVGKLAALGFDSIKLYFLLGLPFENEDEIDAVSDLIVRIYNTGRRHNKKFSLRVNINYFIPKLFTPFAFYTSSYSDGGRTLKKKMSRLLKKVGHKPGLVIKSMKITDAFIQTVISVADITLTEHLLGLYSSGCKPSDFMRSSVIGDFLGKGENEGTEFNDNIFGVMELIDKIIEIGPKPPKLRGEFLSLFSERPRIR